MFHYILKNKPIKIVKTLFIQRNNIFNNKFLGNYQNGSAKIVLNSVKLNKFIPKNLHNIESSSEKSKLYVGSWLLTCSGMVFVAVALGGITRLTESGLSMVTWKLLGEKFPNNSESWIQEFEKYKQFPEYKILNKDLTIEEFKKIYWMEYAHRMWGRLIGAVYILPASYFWWKNMLSPSLKKKVLVLGTLIFCQGFMGWYMVKSGLTDTFDDPNDVPRVSQYRLAAHLSLAVLLYAGFFKSALECLAPVNQNNTSILKSLNYSTINKLQKVKFLSHSTAGLIFLTIVSGAFVAGLDAGLIYNTFPKMSNKWIPDDIFFMTPMFKNITENPTTVQFDHRILGISTLIATTCIGYAAKKYKLPVRVSSACAAVFFTAYLQASLGILTLLNHVPTYLAALHQSGSLLLMTSTVWLIHEMKYIKYLQKFIK